MKYINYNVALRPLLKVFGKHHYHAYSILSYLLENAKDTWKLHSCFKGKNVRGIDRGRKKKGQESGGEKGGRNNIHSK